MYVLWIHMELSQIDMKPEIILHCIDLHGRIYVKMKRYSMYVSTQLTETNENVNCEIIYNVAKKIFKQLLITARYGIYCWKSTPEKNTWINDDGETIQILFDPSKHICSQPGEFDEGRFLTLIIVFLLRRINAV